MNQDQPELKWVFRLFPGSTPFHLPTAPRWFYRQMQSLMFGVVWERMDKPKKGKR